MLTFGDIVGDEYLRAPRIESAELRLLWYSDFWDGPRSGMLVYRGEECWFQVVAESEEDDSPWYRRLWCFGFHRNSMPKNPAGTNFSEPRLACTPTTRNRKLGQRRDPCGRGNIGMSSTMPTRKGLRPTSRGMKCWDGLNVS